MRRGLALFLIVVIVTLSACSKGTDSKTEPAAKEPTKQADTGVAKDGLPIVKETLNLEGLVAKNANVADWNEHPALKELEKRTNIKVKWDCVPDAGFAEKRNLRFASNDLPDFIIRAGLNPEAEMKYVSAKQIVALDPYFDYAPNLSKIMAEDPAIRKNIVLPDGHIYALPQLNKTEGNLVNNYWINVVWLKKLGLGMPKTTEDFYNVLKAFKEKDPNGNGKADEIPFSSPHKNALTLFANFVGSWGFGKNSGMIDNMIDVDDSGKVRLAVIDPRYKEMLEFFNRLWKEGLIDKDTFSMEQAQVTAKVTADVVGFASHGNNNQWMGPKRNNYDQPPMFKGPHGDAIWTNVNPVVQTTGVFVMTSKNKHPEATMRWVDYLYSKEGTVLVRMGIEGKSYTVDKNGKYQLLPEIIKDPTGLTQDQALMKWAIYGGGNMPQFATDDVDQSAAQLPEIKKSTETLRPNLVPYNKLPRLKFTEEETIRMSSYAQDIRSYINESVVKFVTGQQPLSNWDKYVADIKKMNIDDYLSIYQKSYDRWKNAK